MSSGACTKAILDAGAAAAFKGEDPDAAMAEKAGQLAEQIPPEHRDNMSRNDLWLLRQENYHHSRGKWRERLFVILNDMNGGILETT